MKHRALFYLLSALFATTFICCGLFIFFWFIWGRGPFSTQSQAQFLIRLQGGTHIRLEADLPQDIVIPLESMQQAETVVQSRLNSLNVVSSVKIDGNRYLTIEMPGVDTSGKTIETATQMGLLEFVDLGEVSLAQGTMISTTGLDSQNTCGIFKPSDSSISSTRMPPTSNQSPVYRTIMTGSCFRTAHVEFSSTNTPFISITFTDRGQKIFSEHTSSNIGKYLAIAMDKKIISSPQIKSAITGDSAIIEGQFTQQEASDLVTQLRYGALPFQLKIVEITPIR